jgi:putative endonuclease
VAARHLKRGARGEDAAAKHLAGKGYAVMARNWRHAQLELDIVCEDRGTLVFVEVKTRDAAGIAAPADGLTPAKQERLCRAAAAYLSEYGLWEMPCRFDLVAVTAAEDGFEVEHVNDAFQWSPSLRGGNAAWQPW